jgi:hypothetical protein
MVRITIAICHNPNLLMHSKPAGQTKLNTAKFLTAARLQTMCLRLTFHLSRESMKVKVCFLSSTPESPLLDSAMRSTTVTDFISGLALAEEGIFTSPPQLEGDLVTLTVLPRSRWRTLLNFDIIQVILAKAHISTTDVFFSKGTGRKKHRRLQKRCLSSFQLCPEWSHGSS